MGKIYAVPGKEYFPREEVKFMKKVLTMLSLFGMMFLPSMGSYYNNNYQKNNNYSNEYNNNCHYDNQKNLWYYMDKDNRRIYLQNYQDYQYKKDRDDRMNKVYSAMNNYLNHYMSYGWNNNYDRS